MSNLFCQLSGGEKVFGKIECSYQNDWAALRKKKNWFDFCIAATIMIL
jgi:hypothetical protein